MNVLRRQLLRTQLAVRPSFLPHRPMNNGLSLFRFQSSLTKDQNQPQTQPPSPPPPTQQTPNLPESFRKTLPGETDQSNSLMSRLPTFPLNNRSSLLPKPGVPTSNTHTLRSMLEILYQKKAPELLYEAESHKLYFLACGCLAFVVASYAIILSEWLLSFAYQIYKEDGDLLYFAGRLLMNLAIASVATGAVGVLVTLPTRLVRRIWYLPGKTPEKSFIKFTSHPLLPGRATPVHTIALKDFNRSFKGRIFTKNGIYGTLDRGTFFFLLKEKGKRFGFWLVDRNGWFWGDGRVFDVLFGKDTIQVAEEALTYDQQFGKAREKLKEEKKKMKEEMGRSWPLKIGKEMAQDVASISKKMMLKNQSSEVQTVNKGSNVAQKPTSKSKKNKKSKK